MKIDEFVSLDKKLFQLLQPWEGQFSNFEEKLFVIDRHQIVIHILNKTSSKLELFNLPNILKLLCGKRFHIEESCPRFLTMFSHFFFFFFPFTIWEEVANLEQLKEIKF